MAINTYWLILLISGSYLMTVADGSAILTASNSSNMTTKRPKEALMANEIQSNDTKHGKHHHKRVEVIIPADKILEAEEFPEEFEEELGHAKLGKISSKRKLKLRKLLTEKKKRNAFKDMEEELREAENELDDPSLVVTEDSRVDFSTEVIDADGNLVHEEVHSAHHVFKLGNAHPSHGHVLNHKKLQKSMKEPKIPIENLDQSDSSDPFNTIMTHKSVVEKMIRLRNLLDEAIDEFHFDRRAKKKRSDDQNASLNRSSSEHSQNMDLLRDALQQVSKDKRFMLRRKREHADVPSINTCIYVDIPGEEPDTEVEPYFSDNNDYENTENSNSNYEVELNVNENNQSDDNYYHIQEIIHYEDNDIENEYDVYNNEQETQSDTNNTNPIYWMHIPPEETIPNQDRFHELMEVVSTYHREGKDLLFVPVKKTNADSDNEKKHGFLKGLEVNPVNMNLYASNLK